MHIGCHGLVTIGTADLNRCTGHIHMHMAHFTLHGVGSLLTHRAIRLEQLHLHIIVAGRNHHALTYFIRFRHVVG